MVNPSLNEELAELLEDVQLSAEQQSQLERQHARSMEIIKRYDRLNTIAKDIAEHLPRRGYKGKAMVISLDKFTTVRMYDKVMQAIKEEKKKLRREIRKHRNKMNSLDGNGHDLEYRFKDKDDPLHVVFVCAMWLTGFDVPLGVDLVP